MATLLAPDTGRTRACVVDPALFDSTDVIDHAAAARHCQTCPARPACRQAADDMERDHPGVLKGTVGGRRFGGTT